MNTLVTQFLVFSYHAYLVSEGSYAGKVSFASEKSIFWKGGGGGGGRVQGLVSFYKFLVPCLSVSFKFTN